MEGIYKVNLIPNDLSMEETILQIADTLDNLNGIVDDVFTRVTLRIKQNMEKTDNLKKRIEISKAKVEKLTGMQKAIKVFSSAKYPTSLVHNHYKSVFDLNCYQHEPLKFTLSGESQRQPNEIKIQEKLHFYHVKVADPKDPKPKLDNDLESVITQVSAVGDLLIFNTDECPYIRSSSKTPVYVPRVITNVENKVLLEEAPPSIAKRNILKREADEYMYAPGMGMVPELDMPLDLPHLPGIAGDVQFSVTTDGSIAPSAVTSPVAPVAVPELPDLDLKELPDVEDPVAPSVSDIPDAPPPIPPAPPISLPNVMVAPSPPPPPPPPPPQPPMDDPKPENISRDDKPKQPLPPVAGDAHANLMAAIRQAGGAGRAKLRSAAESTSAKGTKAPVGGDLMADLHAKLSMRRRGISGAERTGGGSLLQTLANIIPEPGDQSSPQRSSSDEEWE